ncbi:hypothetical protein GUJ93_ZPchr0013g34933 [Zizania palustris]|uniref:Uncharacterized protein n=1 Tax=Zizania palustris TaxID=103762 RepID=A0A8J5X5F5_ZIZPA|nr:hypothetical protein GUJ93_ZPchr0013g34933 [Zizania palustris]
MRGYPERLGEDASACRKWPDRAARTGGDATLASDSGDGVEREMEQRGENITVISVHALHWLTAFFTFFFPGAAPATGRSTASRRGEKFLSPWIDKDRAGLSRRKGVE